MASPIQHVSDTAFWVAAYRADEGARPDALFQDPLAARLVEGRGRAIANAIRGGSFTAWSVALRTVIIDDFIRDAVAGGCDTVLNLGAGLDTRPYRLELPPSLSWIEVDFPSTIDFKEERLRGEVPRCRLQRIRRDLVDGAERRRLFDEIEGKKILVLTEGVVPYLRNEDVAQLAAELHARPRYVFWVLECLQGLSSPLGRVLGFFRRRALGNAPFQFEPGDWFAFFSAQGWQVRELRAFADEARRVQRPFPLPAWARPLLKLLMRGKKPKAGYAILERAKATPLT
jgi:methyltransferase (TIGR00027 family)